MLHNYYRVSRWPPKIVSSADWALAYFGQDRLRSNAVRENLDAKSQIYFRQLILVTDAEGEFKCPSSTPRGRWRLDCLCTLLQSEATTYPWPRRLRSSLWPLEVKELHHLLRLATIFTPKIQLDWPRIGNWAYAITFAVDLRFPFRDQLWKLDKKLHLILSIKFWKNNLEFFY